MVSPTDGGRPGDADGDGMPDAWNQRMPTLSFVASIIALLPLLFGIKETLRHQHKQPYVYLILTIGLAAAAIIFAVYGARARTKALANAGGKIAIPEIVIALGFIIYLFFKN